MVVFKNMSLAESRETAQRLRRLGDDLLDVFEPGYLEGLRPDVTMSLWRYTLKERPALMGLVEDHPTIADGLMRTSELFFIDERAGLARTYSRWYRLGSKALPPGNLN